MERIIRRVFIKRKIIKNQSIVEKLIEFDGNMREDLVSLLHEYKSIRKPLELLKDMESKSKLTSTMEFYKLKIQESNAYSKPKKTVRRSD